MTVFGVDYACPSPAPAALKKAGVRFVCRYLSTPGNPKNLTAAEARKLRAAGIDIVLVFETTGGRALDGHAAGVADARAAREQASACGAPADQPVYFAVDFDPAEPQLPTVISYINGAASVLGRDATGVYGGWQAVHACLNAKVCRYAWQTYAWSGGVWDPRAQLRQTLNAQSCAGIAVDHDLAVADDFGQWAAAAAPKPAAKPQPPVVITGPRGRLIARRTVAAARRLLPELLNRFRKVTLRKAR